MQINAAAFHQSLHLDDSKLAPPDLECPFCGSRRRNRICVLQDDPKISLLKCTGCNAASASRMPTNNALKEYYENYYDSPLSLDSDEQITFDDCLRFGEYLAVRFSRYQNKKHISILDFGGGDGSISRWIAVQLLKMGTEKVDVCVVDYNDKTVSSQDSRITIHRRDALEDIHSLYDIAIASAIIEHLPQPSHILYRLLNLLEMGGIFYARTPYGVPLMRLLRLFGIKWDFTYPAHVHDLGQDFWESYFNRLIPSTDFEILDSKPSIVETTLNKHFLRTISAYFLKAPWYLVGRRYRLVGGWEILVRKTSDKAIRVNR